MQTERIEGLSTQLPLVPTRYFQGDPEYAKLFMEGFLWPGDSGADPNVKPVWVNDELLARGQQIGREHIMGILFANILSLNFLLAIPSAMNPLIATGKSSTPETARTRYLSTTRRVMQWYHGDLWGDSPAARDVKLVRSMHARVRKLINSASRSKLERAVNLNPKEAEIARPVWPVLEEVLTEKRHDIFIDDNCTNIQREYLNQTEMVATQFGFIGLVLQSPRRLGMHGVTEDDLEALVHLWAAIGYQLGIEDRFNKCIGGLEAARRTWSFYRDRICMPSLAFVNPQWEHMMRCIFKGLREVLFYIPSQKASIWWLMRLNDLPEAQVATSRLMSWTDLVFFWILYFVLEVLMRVNLVRRFLNELLSRHVTGVCQAYLEDSTQDNRLFKPSALGRESRRKLKNGFSFLKEYLQYLSMSAIQRCNKHKGPK